VRNGYTFSLRPSRFQELATMLPDCFQMIRSDMDSFIAFLKQLDVPDK
jgi:hypothetical protein